MFRSSDRLPFRLLVLAVVFSACGRPETPTPVAAPHAETAPVEPAVADDHAGAAGASAPHVHGLADLALTREGNKILGELISPMANFGLLETDVAFTDGVTAELSGLVELEGGKCDAAVPHPMTDSSGDHTDAVVHFVWTCAQPGDVSAVRFAGFKAFAGFETVSTIFITDTQQTAGDLTPSDPELALK